MPYGITCMWNLEYDTNELTHQTNRLTENRLVGAGGGGEGLGEGGGMLGLACIYRMHEQYPMTKHSGKEY